MTPGLAPKAAIPYKAPSGAWLDWAQCQYQRGPLGRKLRTAATLRIKKVYSTGESAIQNKVPKSDQRFRTQSRAPPPRPTPTPMQWNWQNPGPAQGRVLMQVELAKRSSCLDGANVGERRKAKRRPGFITAKEPGLRQPQKVQIWILKGA